MPIQVRLGVMLAERNVKSKDLAEYVGITEANLSLLKKGPCERRPVRNTGANLRFPRLPARRHPPLPTHRTQRGALTMNGLLACPAIGGQRRLLLMAVRLTLEACSSQQLYHTGQTWRQSLGRELAGEDGQRCRSESQKSYSEYQREKAAPTNRR